MVRSLAEDAPGSLIPYGREEYYLPDPLSDLTIDITSETDALASEITELIPELQTTLPTGSQLDALSEDAFWDDAWASSAIEGIPGPYATVSYDPGTGRPDVPAIKNYVLAMKHGVSKTTSPTDITAHRLKVAHEQLLDGIHTPRSELGCYRRKQVQIGGGEDRFIPPSPAQISECMSSLMDFIQTDTTYSWPVKLALTHYQFESIHPFIDGNGRVGRILTQLQLIAETELEHIVLSPSSYLLEHRPTYYDGLSSVSYDGTWDSWIQFYIKGLKTEIQHTIETHE